MILQVFSIFDSKGEFFHVPFFKKTRGEAIRDFTELSNDSNSFVSKYPEDYTLFHIGSFADDCGKLDPVITPTSLGLAIEFIKEK